MSARFSVDQTPLPALDQESAWFGRPATRQQAYDQIDASRGAISRLLGLPPPAPLRRSNRQPALYRLAATALEHQAAIRLINHMHAEARAAASIAAPTNGNT